MLFHITHTHSPEMCPRHDTTKTRNTWGKTFYKAENSGIKLLASYVDAPAHTVYFIVEADSAENITKFLDPVLTMGSAQIRPVTDGLAAVKKRMVGK